MTRLRREAAACTRCPLYANATQTVFGEGRVGGLLLVGEQPGDQEDKAGRPFVGPAVTNAVKHFKWRPRGDGESFPKRFAGYRKSVNPHRLDHLALYVTDPPGVAQNLLSRLPFRVLEETDEFVLVGRSPELGKLMLFRAEGPRERGALVSIGIGIPAATASTTLSAGDGLDLELVPAAADGDVDISHVALRVSDPVKSARTWLAFGFERAGTVGPAERVRLGSAYLVLHPGPVEGTLRPLLNHLGLLVESLDETRRAVANLGFEVEREAEGDDSYALFVRGPDGVEVEYIEHKPSFALA